MKIRILLTAILGILFISGLSLSQEPASPVSASEEPLIVEASSPEPLSVVPAPQKPSPKVPRRPTRTRSSSGEKVVKIFELRHCNAVTLEDLIKGIFSIEDEKIHTDPISNRLIIQAMKGQMDDIMALIEQLDVETPESEAHQTVENLIYRVYMFEMASGDQNLKPFSMIYQMPAVIPSTELLNMAIGHDIQVSDFLIIDERDDEIDVLVQGKAPSNESIQKIAKSITPSQIKELKWDDGETFTSDIEAANFSRLPGQLQSYLLKFLGEEIMAVGYWFGNSSVPGEVEAPIGPWRLRLELKPESDRTLELKVDVWASGERSDFGRQLGRDESGEILSNTLLARIGKPIIIGYNRQSYGMRKMGAMVILPEVDYD